MSLDVFSDNVLMEKLVIREINNCIYHYITTRLEDEVFNRQVHIEYSLCCCSLPEQMQSVVRPSRSLLCETNWAMPCGNNDGLTKFSDWHYELSTKGIHSTAHKAQHFSTPVNLT